MHVTIGGFTPPAVGPWFRRNLTSCGVGPDQIQTGLPDPNSKPTSAWLGRSMRRSRAYSEKTHLFVRFFHVQPKHQNGAVFVSIEGLRLQWNKLGYGASQ